MRRSNSNLRGLSFCSALAFVAAAQAQEEGEWLRHFRIGGSVLFNVSTEFKTSGNFTLNTPPPSARGGVTYDNGFVGRDAFSTQGVTSFWGYNDASQVNTAAKTITFQQTQSFSANGFNEVDDIAPGFDMVYAGTFRKWERVAIGGEFGFGLTAFQTTDKSPMNASLVLRNDVYPENIVVPSAPYVGTDSGTGPLLSTTPSSSSQSSGNGTLTGSRTLEGLLYTFRLGPTVRWEFWPRWTLNGSAGGALGIFDAEYRFNESISATPTSSVNNKGKFGSTDLKYGGYAGAAVMYDTGNYWEAYLGAYFISLQDGKISSGGREATMHLGAAVSITAGINWTF
jgi:hypothetical protein